MKIVAVHKMDQAFKVEVKNVFKTTFAGTTLSKGKGWARGQYSNSFSIAEFNIQISFAQLRGLISILSK